MTANIVELTRTREFRRFLGTGFECLPGHKLFDFSERIGPFSLWLR